MSALPNESHEFLFSPETMERITEAEERREYTVERIKAERPQVIPEVLRLRGQWLSIKKIAKLCNVAVETVVAICGQYADQLKNEHERRVQQLRSAADALIEEILANPNNVPWSVKAPAACQLYEKSELLAGRATGRIEIKAADIFSSFPDFIRSLEERETEDKNYVRPEIGLPSEKKSGGNSLLALPEGDPGNDEIHP